MQYFLRRWRSYLSTPRYVECREKSMTGVQLRRKQAFRKFRGRVEEQKRRGTLSHLNEMKGCFFEMKRAIGNWRRIATYRRTLKRAYLSCWLHRRKMQRTNSAKMKKVRTVEHINFSSRCRRLIITLLDF